MGSRKGVDENVPAMQTTTWQSPRLREPEGRGPGAVDSLPTPQTMRGRVMAGRGHHPGFITPPPLANCLMSWPSFSPHCVTVNAPLA